VLTVIEVIEVIEAEAEAVHDETVIERTEVVTEAVTDDETWAMLDVVTAVIRRVVLPAISSPLSEVDLAGAEVLLLHLR